MSQYEEHVHTSLVSQFVVVYGLYSPAPQATSQLMMDRIYDGGPTGL